MNALTDFLQELAGLFLIPGSGTFLESGAALTIGKNPHPQVRYLQSGRPAIICVANLILAATASWFLPKSVTALSMLNVRINLFSLSDCYVKN